MNCKNKIICLTVFAIAMAFIESAVVVYLRAIFYPDGFQFPLRVRSQRRGEPPLVAIA